MLNGRELSTKAKVIAELSVPGSSLSTAVTLMIAVFNREDWAMVSEALKKETHYA